MKKYIIWLGLAGLYLAQPHWGLAVEKEVFDSTDHYLGACQFTNKSEWEIKEDINVSKFEVWYKWNQNESSLPVKIFFNGEKFAEFETSRGSCDPYQQTWCNANFRVDKLFPKGKYTTEIPNTRQCLKPGGTGAIRLYVDVPTENNATPTLTATPTLKPTTEPTVIESRPTQITKTENICNCKTSSIMVVAAGTSAFVSMIVSIMLRK